jgi:hypothetical protein
MKRRIRQLKPLLPWALLAVLLGIPAMLLAVNWIHNRSLAVQVREVKQQLTELSAARPFASETNTARIRAAGLQAEKLLASAKSQFQPLPDGGLTGRELMDDLQERLASLRELASKSDSRLPAKNNYGFTLGHQKIQAPPTAEGSAALRQTLAQIEWLCTSIFQAHCDLVELRRSRLSYEAPTHRPEFTQRSIVTNATARAVIVPYRLVVEGTSSELGDLLESFANSTNGVIARILIVERGNRQSAADRQLDSSVRARPALNRAIADNAVRATLQLDFINPLD